MHLPMNADKIFPVEPESKIAVGIDIGYSADNSVAVPWSDNALLIDPSVDISVD